MITSAMAGATTVQSLVVFIGYCQTSSKCFWS